MRAEGPGLKGACGEAVKHPLTPWVDEAPTTGIPVNFSLPWVPRWSILLECRARLATM
jgi:hypothetical protein